MKLRTRSVVNARKKPARPSRIDPTRTATLRTAFARKLRQRFARIKLAIRLLVAEEDAFGLGASKGAASVTDLMKPVPTPRLTLRNVTANQRWRFHSDPEKVRAFQAWLKAQFQAEVLGQDERALWEEYVRQGYAKGAGRAFDDAAREGSRAQFLRDSFARPETVEKVQLLAGRSFSDLEGVTEQMSRVMTRTLTDALVQGMNPLDAARLLEDNVDGIGRARAETIARTELIRAHASGQLDAFEDLGVEELGVAVEWLITEDDKVCPQCESLSGVVLTLDEARERSIPLHPNCRCAWIPAGVGEKARGITRGLF